MCSEPVTVMVGGQPVEEGDGLLCRDAESDAWWRATVKAISGSRVLVHYTGCSDEWDLWMEADSTDLMRAEAGGVQPAAFQSEEYEEGLDDEELLDAMRERKWAENARWQLNVFAQEQLGDWQGECTVYHPQPGKAGVPRLVETGSSACASGAAIGGDNTVDWRDELGDAEGLAALSSTATLDSESFYPQKQGNMAVGNAFTLSSGPGSTPLRLELGLKEGAERVRAKLVYDLEQSDDTPQMRLRQVAIVREGAGAAGAADVAKGAPGTGLYDVPACDKQKYCSLYCEGGITLVCPFELPLAPRAEARGCISLDWAGTKMRYQADRKFDALDGSLNTFELTEILTTDSREYPPDFKSYDRG